MKVISITSFLIFSIFGLSLCKGADKPQNSITIAGSTAMQPLVQEAAKVYMTKNAGTTINVQGGGSGTGLTQVASGSIDIGNSDLFAEEKLKDQAKGLKDYKICAVGFGIVVNPKVTVTDLSKEQIVGIFTGKVTNWKDVGGNDMPIVVINRPKSSGTRATFQKKALEGASEVEGKSLTEDSSGAVKKIIETTDGSIGYLSSGYLNEAANTSGLKVIKFNGIEMNKENIANGSYIIASYEHMYTKGEPNKLSKAFIDFMLSEDVKPIIQKLGYIPIAEMKVDLR